MKVCDRCGVEAGVCRHAKDDDYIVQDREQFQKEYRIFQAVGLFGVMLILGVLWVLVK